MKMQNCVVFGMLGLLTCFALVDDVQAQRQGRGFRRFGQRSTTRLELATLDAVQKDLKLTDELNALATSLVEDSRAKRQTLGRGAVEELSKYNAELEKQFMEKLDETQQKRLNGLFVQANGALALRDATVGESLGVTKEQLDEIRTINEANSQKMRDAFQDFQDMTQEERREKFTQLREDATKSLMGVLSEEQQTKLTDLKGEALEMDLGSLRRGGQNRRARPQSDSI